MKLLNTAFALCLPFLVEGQINVVDFSRKEEVQSYDSTYFMVKSDFTDEKVLKGLKGNHITFLDPPSIKLSYVKNGKPLGFFRGDFTPLLYRTFEVIGTEEAEYTMCLKLADFKDTLLLKPSSLTDDYFISEGFERVKSNIVGLKYYSFDEQNVKAVNGEYYQTKWLEPFEMVNFEIGKVSDYEHQAIFTMRSATGDLKLGMKLNDIWFEYGGYPQGSIEFVFDLINTYKMINHHLLDVVNKSNYKSEIRNGTIAVGMTKNEVALIFGMPSSNTKVAGYDDVLVYGQGSKSLFVYIKGGKCVGVK